MFGADTNQIQRLGFDFDSKRIILLMTGGEKKAKK